MRKFKPRTDRPLTQWHIVGSRSVTVSTLTKSEARAAFKRMLGVKRLPPRTIILPVEQK